MRLDVASFHRENERRKRGENYSAYQTELRSVIDAVPGC